METPRHVEYFTQQPNTHGNAMTRGTCHKSLIYMETSWHVEHVTQEPNIHGKDTTRGTRHTRA